MEFVAPATLWMRCRLATNIIDGRIFAAEMRARIAKGVDELSSGHGIKPGLAVVLVGDDAASQVYVRSKSRMTSEVGMVSFKQVFEKSISEKQLLEHIECLNADDRVHGILVQLPLPRHVDEHNIINSISPQKDVDGFTATNVGLMTIGQRSFVPCTPLGCLLMLRRQHGSLSGLSAVVVGRSNIVGKPMSSLLLHENCTVTTTHSHTKNLQSLCAAADLVVAAVGRPRFIHGSWLKKGATVIDVGINRIADSENKPTLVGDVDFQSASEVAGAITPVPGGVGPMTIACLLANTLNASRRSIGLDDWEIITR